MSDPWKELTKPKADLKEGTRVDKKIKIPAAKPGFL